MKRLTNSWLMAMTVATVSLAGAPSAVAAPCAGFTDVDDTVVGASFCKNVEWLKNRGITLGCLVGLYCPNDPVFRLNMAAFMNRLGTAVTPEVLHRQAVFGAASIPGEPPVSAMHRCVTVDTAAATYPRQAVVNASLTGLADGSTAAFRAFLLVSTDSGTSYSLFDAIETIAPRATAAPNAWAGVAMTETLDLAVNTTYLFAIGVRRDDIGPATTGNFAATRCQLTATIFNRNGIASPF